MIKTRALVRAGALALAAVVLAGCAHRPSARVQGAYHDGYGQVAPAGYEQPVYSPRAGGGYDDRYDRYDRYGRPIGGGYPQRDGSYGRQDGYRGGYDGSRYGYGQHAPAGVEFGRVHHIEALSGYRANSGGGALLGGIIGGLVGRQFGNSSTGRAQGTFAGAVGGVLIGNEIERQNRGGGRDGLLVVIALEQGGTREFAVPSVGDLRVGDRVRIEGNRLLRM
jgi:outer membrane lipoprotein SlyB